MQEKQKQSLQSVQVQVLNRRGEVVRTIVRSKESAERLAKYKKTYRIPSQQAETVAKKKVVEIPKTFMDEIKDEKTETNKIIEEINAITDVNLLEPFMNSEIKSVVISATKKFKELTKTK